MRIIFTALIINFLITNALFAGEKDLINSARVFFNNGEYYNAVTDLLRYRYLYPKGEYYPYSMLLLGKSYFKGNNYALGTDYLSSCYTAFPGSEIGEEALFTLGSMRLAAGSPYYALRTLQKYQYVYQNGRFREEAVLKISYAYALTPNLFSALKSIRDYKKRFPNGKYIKELKALENDILYEMNRPKKNPWIAGLGSAVLPGFGHFYTENYKLGFLSFFTNALLIYLIYDGYRKSNTMQMVVFSFAEFSFYQYSIYGALNDVYLYNSRKDHYKKIRLRIGTEF